MVRAGMPTLALQRLNRTSVGLKRMRASELLSLRWGLNRTSVGLKRKSIFYT